MCPFYWFWAEFVRIACSFKSYILLPCSCQKRDSLICSPSFSSNYSAINFVWPINSTKWKETHRKFLQFYLNALESAFSISSIPAVIHCKIYWVPNIQLFVVWYFQRGFREELCILSSISYRPICLSCQNFWTDWGTDPFRAPQNDHLNLSFVKDINTVGNQMTRNGHTAAIYKFSFISEQSIVSTYLVLST